MEKPPFQIVSSRDTDSAERVAKWLNSRSSGDWRITDYSPSKSQLMLRGEAGGRQLCIMCLGTWYVKSQIYIPNPSFVMEMGRKKMTAGMLSGRCYDESVRLAMDDGVCVHEIICDYIAVGEMESEI